MRLMYGWMWDTKDGTKAFYLIETYQFSAIPPLFSHSVYRQYNNLDTTQAWKIRIFYWVCKVECRQTHASLPN